MKVVLLKDVAGVGRAHEVKTVAEGFADNFLIPRKLAEAGTASAIARAEKKQREEIATRAVREDLLLKNLSSLEGVRVEIRSAANEQGHLFASIHPDAVVLALKQQRGIDVLPESLLPSKPLKTVGDHEFEARAHGKSAKFTVIVRAL